MRELDKTMYFRASPSTLQSARLLRKNMTRTEKMLWNRLKGKQIYGIRFRRQHPIDIFITDFYCHEARLVIEVDGEIHCQQEEYDDGRSAEMEKYGIKIIRFKNEDIENSIDEVISKIKITVNMRIEKSPLGDIGVKK